jgi:hypothetical protein
MKNPSADAFMPSPKSKKPHRMDIPVGHQEATKRTTVLVAQTFLSVRFFL